MLLLHLPALLVLHAWGGRGGVWAGAGAARPAGEGPMRAWTRSISHSCALSCSRSALCGCVLSRWRYMLIERPMSSISCTSGARPDCRCACTRATVACSSAR